MDAPKPHGRRGLSPRRALAWAVFAVLAIGIALVGSPAYYWWSTRNHLASLPAGAREILALTPEGTAPPPASPSSPGILWEGVAIPLPVGDSARVPGGESQAVYAGGGIRAAVSAAPAALPAILLREELQAIGGDPSRAPADPLVALGRIGNASRASFRFRLQRAAMEETAAALLAKLRLIPLEHPLRIGWSEDPPGLWAASEAEAWAVRLLPEKTLILRAERSGDPPGADLAPWVAAFSCRWTP
ncbi:MAG: hypothetical protein JXP34_11040 [Planctomycetes bacterium]|nr:hypothetical protein [Planctomycetota bacterium]